MCKIESVLLVSRIILIPGIEDELQLISSDHPNFRLLLVLTCLKCCDTTPFEFPIWLVAYHMVFAAVVCVTHSSRDVSYLRKCHLSVMDSIGDYAGLRKRLVSSKRDNCKPKIGKLPKFLIQ